MVKITISDLSFSYRSRKILDDLNLEVRCSEVLGLVGPNGSGKTTLLKCIDQILKPKGSLLLNGREIGEMSRQEIARFIGYVPQSNTSSSSTTVFDIILMGRRPYMGWRVGESDLDKVAEIVDLLDLDDLAMKDFNELSGGQKQKVLIARAICQEPQVLLLDEPTSNLDMKHQLEVLEIVRDLVKEKGISAVMAIHDLNLASRFGDKLAVLLGGSIYAAGDPRSLLNKELIRTVYGVEALVVKDLDKPYIVPMRSLNGRSAG
ncbi:MAG: ABC transporter ATP-binding protein [Methanotrichaceae archaeon]|nr:ABC transporter ATP-binding protein [Methanotrichaceae archaeon]